MRFHSVLRAIQVPLVIAIAATLALGAPVPANAAVVQAAIVASADDQNASVSGLVTGIDGSPAGGVRVNLTRVDVYDYWSNRHVDTDLSGTYSFAGLPAGTYTLRFSCTCCSCSAPFREEWWTDRPDAATADRFTLAPGQQLTGLVAQLSSGSKISGFAVGVDGSPLAKVNIQLYRVEGETFTASGSRQTDSNGSFLFNGLEPGQYTLEFAPPWESNHLRTWWGGSADQTGALILDVGQDQQLTGLSAQMRPGAVVTGVVRGADGAPLGGQGVELLRATGSGWDRSNGTRSRDDGVYTFIGLEPGTYSISFLGRSLSDDVRIFGEAWRDKPADEGIRDTFEVSQGQEVTGMDAELSTRRVELPKPFLSTFSPFVGVPVIAEVSSPTPGVEFQYQWFINGNPATGETSRSFVPLPEHFGAEVSVRVIATAPGYSPVLGESYSGGPVHETTRLAGADRFGTAVAISESAFESDVPVAFIASGYGFADALAGCVLAVQQEGPVLLSPPDGLPDVVVAELQRLRPQRIVILGGPAVINPVVEQRLRGLTSGDVTRLAGADRFATAIEISKAGFEPGVPIAFLASGLNYPDALAGAPIAGELGGPLLLTPQHEIPQSVKDEFKRLRPQRLVVLGGDAAISGQLGYELDALAPEVTIVSGADRYETASLLQSYFPGTRHVGYIASGANFPDALAAAPIVGLAGERILLTPPDSLHPATKQALELSMLERLVILGGPGAVSENVKSQLEALNIIG